MADVAAESMLRLLRAALDGGKHSVSRLLQCTAEIMHAEGCALWQVKPDSDIATDEQSGQLFVLASWFRGEGLFAVHDLSLASSATGNVVRHQAAQCEYDVRNTGGRTRAIPFFDANNIGPMCSVPVNFADGPRGALNVYRTNQQASFTDADASQLTLLAQAVPLLYQASRDRVSLDWLNRIDKDLQDAKVVENGESVPAETMRRVFDAICKSVQQMVNCLEVSVYLEDRLTETGTFRLWATTWPEAAKEDSYCADVTDGLTGWALARKQSVNLFDSLDFGKPEAAAQIERKYPKLRWRDLNEFPATVLEKLGLAENSELPPASYMAAPITYQEQVCGVIRCCTARSGPYYFSERDLQRLELVAGRIGQFWEGWLSSRELQKETQYWQAMVRELSSLNEQFRQQLSVETPDENIILKQALQLSRRVITGATVNGIRRVNEETNELCYAVFDDESYDEIETETKRELDAAGFSLGEPYQSAGAYVASTGKPYWIPVVEDDLYFKQSQGPFLSSTVKCALFAPIKVGAKVFGTLDLRGKVSAEFPRYAEEFAELIGGQLGLYLHSLATIGELRALKIKAERDAQLTSRRFQDLAHQLRGPIIQLQKRSEIAVSRLAGRADPVLFAIRGLARKAWQVTLSMKLLGELHRGGKIKPTKQPLRGEWLVKRLIELYQDCKSLCPPDRNITGGVEAATFAALSTQDVWVDRDLFEHAISNLLDNAFKYSSKNGSVTISGGHMPQGNNFYLTITNVGIPISKEDVELCIAYGWRSALAKWVTGEGSGIGLWLVDHIMKAHDGVLLVSPTDAEGKTTIRLVFPYATNP